MKNTIKKFYNFISNLHWTGNGEKIVKHRWCYFHHWYGKYPFKKLLGIKFKGF